MKPRFQATQHRPQGGGWGAAVAVGVLLLASASCRSQPKPAPIRLPGALVPFTFCYGRMDPAKVVQTSERIGFHGAGLTRLVPSEIQAYSRLPAVTSGRFRIESALWWIRATDSIDTAVISPTLRDARSMGTTIWLVVSGKQKGDKSAETRERALRTMRVAADLCRKAGVRLVLYPHAETVMETFEESLPFLDSLAAQGHPEVTTSIHVCHERLAGNGARLPELVAMAGPRLGLVSVNGASSSKRSILPLDKGSFDPRPFLAALSDIRYSGPVELHTFQLPAPDSSNYDGHLERSLAWWKANTAP